jgi:hypothetical protein
VNEEVYVAPLNTLPLNHVVHMVVMKALARHFIEKVSNIVNREGVSTNLLIEQVPSDFVWWAASVGMGYQPIWPQPCPL